MPIPVRCFYNSSASFEAGGGGGGPTGEFGGGGGGGGDGGDANPKAVAAEEFAGSSGDVIILDVGVSVLSCFASVFFRNGMCFFGMFDRIWKMVVRE